MSALMTIPHRDRLQAVLVLRVGLGWHVGVGSLVACRIEGEHQAFMQERKAHEAALALGDARDLIVVQA